MLSPNPVIAANGEKWTLCLGEAVTTDTALQESCLHAENNASEGTKVWTSAWVVVVAMMEAAHVSQHAD